MATKKIPALDAQLPPEIIGPDGLSVREEAFCREYLVDMNGTRAAVRVGFPEPSASNTAYRLLKRDEILTRVQELARQRSVASRITAQSVLDNLQLVLDRCLQAVPVLDRDGNQTGEWQFDSRGATKALELMGKHLAMFTEKVEVSTTVGLADRLRAALSRVDEVQQGRLPKPK